MTKKMSKRSYTFNPNLSRIIYKTGQKNTTNKAVAIYSMLRKYEYSLCGWSNFLTYHFNAGRLQHMTVQHKIPAIQRIFLLLESDTSYTFFIPVLQRQRRIIVKPDLKG